MKQAPIDTLTDGGGFTQSRADWKGLRGGSSARFGGVDNIACIVDSVEMAGGRRHWGGIQTQGRGVEGM